MATTSVTDIGTFNAGYERHWGFRLLNRSLDTMDLTCTSREMQRLPAGPGFVVSPSTRSATCSESSPHDRHTACGDAFMTAQVFLRLLHLASRHGRRTLDDRRALLGLWIGFDRD